MNPMRSLFLSISRIPPAIMLLIIVGTASLVTLQVTSHVNGTKDKYDDEIAKLKNANSAKAKIVYVIKDVPEGTTIGMEALEERELEVSKIPVDSIPSASLAAGRSTKYGVVSGQILSQHDLAPQGAALGFESRLREGMRAVTFAVDNNSGVAGLLQPESHVDVLAMVGAGTDTKAAAILSDVEVIAVGQTYQRQPGSGAASPASSITVAVSPEDTQKLIKGVAASKLYLALRNDKDHSPIATVDVTALFPKSVKTGNEIAMLQPPNHLSLPEPPILMNDSVGISQGSSATAPPVPLHEIDVWTAGKKDVISVGGK